MGPDAAIIQALLGAGADLELRDSHRQTALHYAAVKASPAVLRLLLDAGADVGACNAQGRTPLLVLLLAGRHYGLSTGPTQRSRQQQLRQAVEWDESTAHLLLAAGSDANAKGNDGYSALSLAIGFSTLGTVQILKDAGVSFNEIAPANRASTSFVFAGRDLLKALFSLKQNLLLFKNLAPWVQ